MRDRLLNIVFWLALMAWVSVLVSAAVAATGTFTVLPRLDLIVSGYTLDSPEDYGRLAAGKVMDPIFRAVDRVQFIAAALVLATVFAQHAWGRLPARSATGLVRLAALLAATALLAYRAVAIMPGMNEDLRAYWSASAAGDAEVARTHRHAFDELHPVASKLYSGTLICLVIAVGASAVMTSPKRREPTAA